MSISTANNGTKTSNTIVDDGKGNMTVGNGFAVINTGNALVPQSGGGLTNNTALMVLTGNTASNSYGQTILTNRPTMSNSLFLRDTGGHPINIDFSTYSSDASTGTPYAPPARIYFVDTGSGSGELHLQTKVTGSISNALTDRIIIGDNGPVTIPSGGTLAVGGSAVTSALLTLTSTTQGLLIPSMTTTQKNAISTPATGLQVYDSTLKANYIYNSNFWAGGPGFTPVINFVALITAGVGSTFTPAAPFTSSATCTQSITSGYSNLQNSGAAASSGFWLQYSWGSMPPGIYCFEWQNPNSTNQGTYSLVENTTSLTLAAAIDAYAAAGPFILTRRVYFAWNATNTMAMRFMVNSKNASATAYYLFLCNGLTLTQIG